MLGPLFRDMACRWDDTAFTDDHGRVSNGELLDRATAVADTLSPDMRTIGLTGPNNIAWVANYLGCLMARRTVVPIPDFFSDEQRRHIAGDAGIDTVLSSGDEGVPERLSTSPVLQAAESADDWRLIIYTSGTTGAPKGVRLGPRQVQSSVKALSAAVAPGPGDSYLSLLPFSLLLEQVTGILVPLATGIRCDIATRASARALSGDIGAMVDAIDRARPSLTVLVPDLLAGWVAMQEHRHTPPTENLRFVAVGGATVPVALTVRAREAGIPAYAGYGLSECCSVVAVNTPGADRIGSVGRCLPGRFVSIDDGEIVVAGTAVMDGYLGREDTGNCWRTGDMGHLDTDGYLYVHGRKDNVLVTARGRNVSPEWIESLFAGDPRIARCIVTGSGLPTPKAVVVPTTAGASWFANASDSDLRRLVEERCRLAPAYARPGAITVATEQEFKDVGCLARSGAVDRQAVQRRYGMPDQSPGQRKIS
jgi:long-chain acyl-CoA synthetase